MTTATKRLRMGFDYARAWAEVAIPTLLELSPEVRGLLALVAECYQGTHQNSWLGMDWLPGVREAFDQVPSADLALASRTFYYAGHWWPGKVVAAEKAPLKAIDLHAGLAGLLPGKDHGAHWKFSHLADQLLRVRAGQVESQGQSGRDRFAGWGWRIHEGVWRLCWSSKHSWCWEEVCPATLEPGVEAGRQVVGRAAWRAVQQIPERQVRERDSAAYSFLHREYGSDKPSKFERRMEEASAIHGPLWPGPWAAWVRVSEKFQREVSDGRY